MNISGEVVRTSQLPKKTLGLNDSLVALMSSPLETVTVPVSDFVSFVATQLLTASADSLDSVTTVGNTTANTITIGGATSPYYQLNTLSPGTQAVGRFVWNDVDGTVDLGLKGGNVTLQVGQETVVRVVNKTGANLLESQYKVVRVRTQAEGGAQGQRLAVLLARANTKANHTGILGIVTENINNNQEGFVTAFGEVKNINTTGSLQGETWLDGDSLWLSDSVAGGLTKVEPTTHPVQIGYIVYAHANNGKIFVRVNEGVDELNELHDVTITSATTGQLFQYNSGTWVNWTPNYLPSASVSGTTNYLSKFTGTTTLGNSLVYDNGTNVGIGTTSPTDRLHIVDASNANIFGRVTANGTNASAAWVAQNDQVDNVVYRVFGSGATGTQMGIALARSASLLANLGGTGSFLVGTFSNTDFILGTANTERARINTSGNFLIGTTIDAGYKLDVNGLTRVQGTTTVVPAADTSAIVSTGYSVTGSGTTPLIDLSGTWNTTGAPTAIKLNVTNTASAANSLLMDLQIGGSSRFQINALTSTVLIQRASGGSGFRFKDTSGTNREGALGLSGAGTRVEFSMGSGITSGFAIINSAGWTTLGSSNGTGQDNTITIGTNGVNTTVFPSALLIGANFSPTSGTGTWTLTQIAPTINQTGGANGITRGLYVNPTITSAATWRSVEWSNSAGWGLFGAGTAPNYLGGGLVMGTTSINSSALFQVDSTTKGILGPRMTTAQILAISTPAEGLYVYNTDLKTLCFYNGTAWQKVTSTAM
jgi:hypothetical protein